MIELLIAGYVACGALAYAIAFADIQRRFPEQAAESYREDVGMSLFFGLLGPVGLLVTFLASGFAQRGLKWW